jgi:hypothetical protein
MCFTPQPVNRKQQACRIVFQEPTQIEGKKHYEA